MIPSSAAEANPPSDDVNPPQDSPSRAAKPIGVLVVDDEHFIRAVLDNGLRYHGFDVFTAGTCAEAREVYQANHAAVSVVLMDVQMPILDGPKTLLELQQCDPSVRCCFMTGGMSPYTEGELLRMGAAYILRKPFSSLDELARLLRQVAGDPSQSAASVPDGAGDRRRAPRYDGNAVQVVLAAPKAVPASGMVLNRSVNGLSIRVDRVETAGTVLNLSVAAAQARVEVKYCRPHNQYWVLGCQYVGAPPGEVLQLLATFSGDR